MVVHRWRARWNSGFVWFGLSALSDGLVFFSTFVVLPPALHFLQLYPVFLYRFLYFLTFRVLILSPCLIVRSFVYWKCFCKDCLWLLSFVWTYLSICNFCLHCPWHLCLSAHVVCLHHSKAFKSFCFNSFIFCARETACGQTRHCFWNRMGSPCDYVENLTPKNPENSMLRFYKVPKKYHLEIFCQAVPEAWPKNPSSKIKNLEDGTRLFFSVFATAKS